MRTVSEIKAIFNQDKYITFQNEEVLVFIDEHPFESSPREFFAAEVFAEKHLISPVCKQIICFVIAKTLEKFSGSTCQG